MADPLLRVEDVYAGYGPATVVKGVSLLVDEGEAVGIVGPNGAGKSTLLKTILGSVQVRAGTIQFGSSRRTGSPEAMIKAGVALVPEGRRVFASLTVIENLVIGGYTRRRNAELQSDLDRMLEWFPALVKRRNQLAGRLSGGEQQMLAIARALLSRPRLLLLDEPSMGLAPMLIEQLSHHINQIRRELRSSVLLVEQDMSLVASVASRVYVMNVGKMVASGPVADFLDQNRLADAFWGSSGG